MKPGKETIWKGKHLKVWRWTEAAGGGGTWWFYLPGTFNSGCNNLLPLSVGLVLSMAVWIEPDQWQPFLGFLPHLLKRGVVFPLGLPSCKDICLDLCHCKGRSCLRIKPIQMKPEPKMKSHSWLTFAPGFSHTWSHNLPRLFRSVNQEIPHLLRIRIVCHPFLLLVTQRFLMFTSLAGSETSFGKHWGRTSRNSRNNTCSGHSLETKPLFPKWTKASSVGIGEF